MTQEMKSLLAKLDNWRLPPDPWSGVSEPNPLAQQAAAALRTQAAEIDALAKRLGEQGLEIIESAKSLAMNESALAEKDASIRAAERAVGRREGREEIARAMERLAHNRDREVAALHEGAFKRASMGEAMAFREAARVARVLLTKEAPDA